MKRGMKILLGLLVLGLLIAGLFFVKQSKSKKESEKVDTVKKEDIIVSQIEKDSITTMELHNEEGTFHFYKEDDDRKLWQVKGYEDFTVKSYNIANLETFFTSLKATRDLGQVEDLEEFGLGKDAKRVKVNLADNTSKEILIGKMTAERNACYVKLADEDKVYTVYGKYGVFANYGMKDFRQDPIINVDLAQGFSYFYLQAKDQRPLEIVYKPDEGTYTTHVVTRPYEKPRALNSYGFENKIMPLVPAINIDAYVDDEPKDLALYGLDKPELRIIVESMPDENNKKKRMAYAFGKRFEEDGVSYIYFMPADESRVYAMRDTGALTDLQNAKSFDLVDSLIYIVNLLDVEEINIASSAESYGITIDSETITNDENEEEVKQTFFLEGKQVEDEKFRDLYQLIIGLSADFEIFEELDLNGQEQMTIDFKLTDGSTKNLVYAKYPEDPNFYVAKVEQGLYYAISTQEVQRLFDALKEEVNSTEE